MHRPRLTRALGAATGVLLGVATLPVAAALADDYAFVPDPNSTEVVTGMYGLYTALPGLSGSVQGHQMFAVEDTTLGTAIGKIEADVARTSGVFFGGTNEHILVTADVAGTPGTAAGEVPPVGSVFDTFMFGDTGYGSIYSALASPTPGGDLISETFVTPFGDYTTPLVFDAARVPVAEMSALVTEDYGFTPISEADITAVSGIPPLAQALQGSQEFATAAGTFNAETITTYDYLGNATEAIVVTSASGTIGTAAGEVPPVGSVFNIITTDFDGYDYVYSDLAPTTPGGAPVITETLVTPYGDFPFPNTLDATAAIAANETPFPLSDDYTLVPTSIEQFTGVNGVPPFDVAIQGYQQFEIDNTILGTAAGTFNADVSTSADSYGDIDRLILVTSDLSGTAGTAAGDVPPVGSVFDLFTFGDSGYANLYIDIASTTPGGDLILDTFITPHGDITIPATLDLAAGLANLTFLGL